MRYRQWVQSSSHSCEKRTEGKNTHRSVCLLFAHSGREKKSPDASLDRHGHGSISSVRWGYLSRWNPLPTRLGSQCQGGQQGRGAAPSAWGSMMPTPGFWKQRHLAGRSDSQHLRWCICNAFKRHWKKDGASTDWFLPLLRKLVTSSRAPESVCEQQQRLEVAAKPEGASTTSEQSDCGSHFIFFCTLISLSGLFLLPAWQSHLRPAPAASPASSNLGCTHWSRLPYLMQCLSIKTVSVCQLYHA